MNQKPNCALLKVTVQKSTIQVVQELTELVGQLVDIVKSLQTQRPSLASGLDNALGVLHMVGSGGEKGLG